VCCGELFVLVGSPRRRLADGDQVQDHGLLRPSILQKFFATHTGDVFAS
jgi:hypothetical protein